MNKRPKPTYRQQLTVCAAVSIICVLLAYGLQEARFHNLHFLVWGTAFLWNPVWPASWQSPWPEKQLLGTRIGAGLLLSLGLFGRFGV